jgi:hypothetical protein
MRDTGERLTRGHLTMIVAHRAMVRDLALIAEAARSNPDSTRTRALFSYSARLLELIDHHHSGEDEVLWPLLKSRGAPQESLDALQSEHAELHTVLENLRAATELAELADAAERTREVLAEHTEAEERALAGALAPALDGAAWRTFERAMLRTAPRWSLGFMPGWLASAATDEERRGLPGAAVARFIRGKILRLRRNALEPA